MKLDLQSAGPSTLQTEILVVFATDKNTGKEKNAKPEIDLLTSDEAVQRAASLVLVSGEFKAKANETLVLHSPQGLEAARLLLVGVGKAASFSIHDLRKAAGTAVRYAKPRGIRSLAVLAPANFGAAQTCRAIAEGAVVADFESDTYRTDRQDQ